MSFNNMNNNFKKKYLKYKYKYLELKKQIGGNPDETTMKQIMTLDKLKRAYLEKGTEPMVKVSQMTLDELKRDLDKFTKEKKSINDLENVLLGELSEYEKDTKPKDVAVTPSSDLSKTKPKDVAVTPSSDLSKIKELKDLKISNDKKLVNFIDINLNENSEHFKDLHKNLITYSRYGDNLEALLKSVTNVFINKLKIDKDSFISSKSKLGKGSYGTVYKIESKDNNYALKFSKTEEEELKDLEEEINYTKILSDNEITPKYYGSINYTNVSNGVNYSFLLSEAYDINLNDYFKSYIPWYLKHKDVPDVIKGYKNIEERINIKLLELSKLLIFCVDLKPQNIVIKYDKVKTKQVKDLKLIDWGGDFCKDKNNLSEKNFPDRELLKQVIYEMMVLLIHLWFKHYNKLEFMNEVISEIESKLNKNENYREYFAKLLEFQGTLLILQTYYIKNGIYSDFEVLIADIFGRNNLEKLLKLL
jgi:hypothetical protein